MSTAIAGWWQRRRLIVLAAAIAVAATVSLIVALSPGRATSGGDPYSVPGVVDTNPDPNIVETTLVSDETTVDIGNGVTAHAQTYNGTIPGPTFRLKVGDTVIVHYENHLEHASAIHWHGIELANGMDGTPFTQNIVEPGGTFLYKFTVTRPGLYWYHPHHHSSTNQVFKGLYGMIIVEDPNEAALRSNLTIPSAADTHPIVLSDTTVCKQPPNNDTATYPASAPHVSGASPFPEQAPPTPKKLCETAPIDENGDPAPPYAAGDIPSIQSKATSGRTNEGQTVLTNGKNVGGRAGTPAAPGALAAGASTLNVQARQGVRLQILNAAAIRYMRLRLTTSTGVQVPLTRIGGEGGLLDKAVTEGGHMVPPPGGTFDTQYEIGEILLPPGSRADVAFGIPANATGVLTMWTEDYQRVGQLADGFYANTATVPVMHFSVNGSAGSTYDIAGDDPLRNLTGNPVEQLGAPANLLLNPAGFNPVKKGLNSQQIALTTGNNQLSVDTFFGTHDVQGDYTDADHLGSSRYAKEGDLLQLDIQNMTDAHHPFHLHGFSIQPRTLTKSGSPTFSWPYHEFRDNVDIPARYTLTFRIRLDPRPMPDGTTLGGALGRWVFHCHIFFHATNGMLSELVVTTANGNERPDVNVVGSGTSVEQDQQATIKGTYKDRDGDPVTLTTSKGTVTDDGGGKFTWTYPTTVADSSGLVFVTATDSGGRKGQTAFQLQVANTPPTLVLPGAQLTGVGDAPNFAVAATDPNTTDPVTLSASGLPAGLAFTDNGNRTGTVSGNVTAAPGQYTATFTANDGKNPPVTGTVPITVTAQGVLTGVVSNPERMVKRAITVGCRLGVGTFQSCRATVLRGTSQAGQATTTLPAAGTTFTNVRVPLNKATRARVARSIPGVPVTVNFLALTFESPANLTASKKTKVVAPRVVARPKFAIFKPSSAKPTARGKRFLKKIAKQVKKARRIDCIAHAPLAKKRAAAGCAILRKAGLRAKYKRVRARPKSNRMQVAILR